MITFKQFITEASRGIDKWEKYFGSSDVETLVKSDADLYDAFGNKTKKKVKKGDKITVLAGEYDTKPLIRVDDGEYRLSFAAIDKPFKINQSVQGNLKPDFLGLDGETKFSKYADEVKKALDDHDEIPDEQTEFLKALVDHAAKPDDAKAKKKVQDLYASTVKADSALQRTINNDFMEVLGPFFVVAEQPEHKSSTVSFPTAGNEPLFDFELIEDVPTQYSSKRSGGRTNTLKAAQVWQSIQDNPDLKKKYKREIEVLALIKDNPVRLLPDKLNEWLAKNFKQYKLQPATTDNTTIARLESSTVKFINDVSDLDFVPLVRDAIPDIWYVKAKLNSDGTIKVEPLKNGRSIQQAKLRSKSSPNHLSDKLGFEV